MKYTNFSLPKIFTTIESLRIYEREREKKSKTKKKIDQQPNRICMLYSDNNLHGMHLSTNFESF